MGTARSKDVRVIHVRLPANVHRKLRIRAAEEDTTIQEWVSTLIGRALKVKREGRRKQV